MDDDKRPLVFLSHIHEEASLGAVIKTWIEDAFAGQVVVFLSSDPKDIPGSKKWLEEVHRKLSDPRLALLVSLISPQSIKRPWISIELGAVWIQNEPVLPFCHSGIKKGGLPRPLGDFSAIEIDDRESAKLLMDAIGSALGLAYSRKLALNEMTAEMRKACEGFTYESEVAGPPTAAAASVELDDEEIAILQVLCRTKDRKGDGDVLATDLSKMVGIPLSKLEWRMDSLITRELARDSWWGPGRHFSIQDGGTDALLRLGKYPN